MIRIKISPFTEGKFKLADIVDEEVRTSVLLQGYARFCCLVYQHDNFGGYQGVLYRTYDINYFVNGIVKMMMFHLRS